MQYIAPIMLKIEARHSHVLIVYIHEIKRRQSLGRIALVFECIIDNYNNYRKHFRVFFLC